MTDSHDRDGADTANSGVTSPSPAETGSARPPSTLSPERPLPPLPDGGLAEAMPEWLRAAPASPAPPTMDAPPDHGLAATAQSPVAASEAHGDLRDPTTYLSPDDLPAWIHQLVARERATPEPTPIDQPLVDAAPSVDPAGTGAATAPFSRHPAESPLAEGDSLLARTPPGAVSDSPVSAHDDTGAAVETMAPPVELRTPNTAATSRGRTLLPYAIAAILLVIAVITYLVSNGMLR